ncbi:MAG: hypothetical protein AB1445_09035 [Bacillota bacterium]
MRLPDSFRPLFHNYVFDTVDDEIHCPMVVKTTLAYGSWEQILWLFGRYGRKRVREVFLRDYHGPRTLPASTSALWSLVFLAEDPAADQS